MKILKWFLLFLIAVMLVREFTGAGLLPTSVLAEIVTRFNAGFDSVMYSIAQLGALWKDPGSMAWYEIVLTVLRTLGEAFLVVPRIIYELGVFLYEVFDLFFSLGGSVNVPSWSPGWN